MEANDRSTLLAVRIMWSSIVLISPVKSAWRSESRVLPLGWGPRRRSRRLGRFQDQSERRVDYFRIARRLNRSRFHWRIRADSREGAVLKSQSYIVGRRKSVR